MVGEEYTRVWYNAMVFVNRCKTMMHIAIDGPVAAGKGTVARRVAEELGILYVDTGAMYRVAALLGERHGVEWENEDRLAELVTTTVIAMRNPLEDEQDGRQTTVLLNGEDVSWEIRTEEMGKGASKVAQHAKVREALVKKQQDIAAVQSVVMEGRDITYRVLPNAQIKIYLTADENERARRRYAQLRSRGIELDFEQVLRDLRERDEQDMNRATDPLRIVDDAWLLDTTSLTIDAVVGKIVERANRVLVE